MQIKEVESHIENILSKRQGARYDSYISLLDETNKKVTWAYRYWDKLEELLTEGDDHQRSIAAQLLANLTKSDPEGRMSKTLLKLIEETKDERFVSAHHTLQCLWKVGIENEELESILLDGLIDRYVECENEKNFTLIRYDIHLVLRKVYDVSDSHEIITTAKEFIFEEEDPQFKRKLEKVWGDIEM